MLERESSALRSFIAEWPERVTSIVARIEVERAVRRAALGTSKRIGRSHEDVLLAKARETLDRLSFVWPTRQIVARAASVQPSTLRTLEAIHLGTALDLEGLGGFVSYDGRLLEAAREGD